MSSWSEESRQTPVAPTAQGDFTNSYTTAPSTTAASLQSQQRQRNQPISSGIIGSNSSNNNNSTIQHGNQQQSPFPQSSSSQSQQASNMSYQFLTEPSHSTGPFAGFHSSQSYPGDPSQAFQDLRASPRSYVPIAPDPAGVYRMHIRQGGEFGQMDDVHIARQHSTGSTYRESPTPPMLRDEDRLLLQLKDEESLPWRDIVARMSSETGQSFQIPALQMRYRRLKDRMRIWTPQDLEALRKAHEYWETKKFEIIANKMQEFGVEEKWTPRACQRKWNELNPSGEDMVGNLSRRSTLISATGSPQAPYTFHMEPTAYGGGGGAGGAAPPPTASSQAQGYW